MMEVFQDYAYYYNLFYGDKNYAKEAKEIHELLSRYSEKDIVTLLNLGCGTGKHDSELDKLGYKIHGIDFSQEMINIANENSKSNNRITFEVANVQKFRADRKFDGVISLFHVMSYQNSNKEIIESFQTAYESLEKGGIFLFDVWNGAGVLSEKPSLRVKKLEDEKNSITRIANPIMHANRNIVDVNYEVYITNKSSGVTRIIEETHHMRYFFVPEIEMLLKMVGFELITCLDCNNLQEPTYDSWTVYYMARKI